MYKKFYQLNSEPFGLTPDPQFVFAHSSYRKASAYMQHTLQQGDGFLVITGRSGTGKTTLVEDFLAQVSSAKVLTATLVSTQLDVDDLLRMVAYSFNLNPKGLDKASLLRELEKFLKRQPRTLLIIDEAQNLSPAALEEVRMLTNLHVRSRPLLQIFLLGQERLRDLLQQPEMEQLHQRLMAACYLEPLTLEETQEYVLHRLGCAGWQGDPTISPAAVVLIHRFSQGLPRYISKICARLFLHGAVEQRHLLGPEDLLTVVREIEDELLLPFELEQDLPEQRVMSGLRQLLNVDSMPDDWQQQLSKQEWAFIDNCPDPAELVPKRASPATRVAPVTRVLPDQPQTDEARPIPEYRPAVSRPDVYARPVRSRRRLLGGHRRKLIGYGAALSVLVAGLYGLGSQNARQLFSPVQDLQPANAGQKSEPVRDSPRPGTEALVSVGLLPPDRQIAADRSPATDQQPTARSAEAELTSDSQAVQAPAVAADREGRSPVVDSTRAPADLDLPLVGPPEPEPAGPQPPPSVATLEPDPGNGQSVASAGADDPPSTPVAEAASDPVFVDQAGASTRPVEQSIAAVAADDRLPVSASVETVFSPAVEAPMLPRQVQPEEQRSPGKPQSPAVNTNGNGLQPVALQQPATAAIDQPPEHRLSTADNAATGVQQDQLQTLLRQGEQALADNRLRFPESRSAWHYYRQAQKLDPANADARQGLLSIARRYRELALGLAQQQRYKKALLYINRGLGVVDGDPELLALRQEVELQQEAMIQLQERKQMLALQAQEARALAAAERYQSRAEPRPEGFFGTLKTLFSGASAPSSEDIFNEYDR